MPLTMINSKVFNLLVFVYVSHYYFARQINCLVLIHTPSELCPQDAGISGTNSLAAATHLLQCLQLNIESCALYAHKHSNATALQCIHSVRAVHHEVVILFVG